jgi:hypothetical protein
MMVLETKLKQIAQRLRDNHLLDQREDDLRYVANLLDSIQEHVLVVSVPDDAVDADVPAVARWTLQETAGQKVIASNPIQVVDGTRSKDYTLRFLTLPMPRS